MGMEENVGQRMASQDEVTLRALCLGAVGALSAAALDSAAGPSDQAESWAAQVREWVSREGLVPALSGVERLLVPKPIREWGRQEVIDANWRAESIGVLLWALSMVHTVPPYDHRFEGVVQLVPVLRPTSDFRRAARVRPDAEIKHARDLAELWHWRSRTTQLQSRPDLQPDGVDLAAVVTQAATICHRRGDLPAPVGGDFPAFGKPYRDLSSEEYSLATSIAMERHCALNWLCGYSADWDQVPTDT